MNQKQYFVYIMAKGRNSTFYVGMTSDLPKRVWEHKNGIADGFTKKYGIKNLVYFEVFNDPERHQTRKASEKMDSGLENENH